MDSVSGVGRGVREVWVQRTMVVSESELRVPACRCSCLE